MINSFSYFFDVLSVCVCVCMCVCVCVESHIWGHPFLHIIRKNLFREIKAYRLTTGICYSLKRKNDLKACVCLFSYHTPYNPLYKNTLSNRFCFIFADCDKHLWLDVWANCFLHAVLCDTRRSGGVRVRGVYQPSSPPSPPWRCHRKLMVQFL